MSDKCYCVAQQILTTFQEQWTKCLHLLLWGKSISGNADVTIIDTKIREMPGDWFPDRFWTKVNHRRVTVDMGGIKEIMACTCFLVPPNFEKCMCKHHVAIKNQWALPDGNVAENMWAYTAEQLGREPFGKGQPSDNKWTHFAQLQDKAEPGSRQSAWSPVLCSPTVSW